MEGRAYGHRRLWAVPGFALLDWLTGEKESAGYVDTHLDEMRHVALGTYAFGLWSGFRAAWLLVGVAIAIYGASVGERWIVLAAVTVLTTLVSLVVASDMSRTLMVLMPVALVGTWRLPAFAGRRGRYALAALLVANLLLPATHVVWTRTFPVHSLPTEIANLRNPPGWVYAPEHFRRGNQLLSEGRADEARKEYSEAIRLENRWIAPHIQRAAASVWLGDIDNAGKDIDAVLAADPRCFDALLMRATFPSSEGDVRQNISDLEQALQFAPPNWPPRAQAEEAHQPSAEEIALSKKKRTAPRRHVLSRRFNNSSLHTKTRQLSSGRRFRLASRRRHCLRQGR